MKTSLSIHLPGKNVALTSMELHIQYLEKSNANINLKHSLLHVGESF